jgi:dihydropteroate synthase
VFPRPALVMGVVNVTPDSFSDGGKFLDARPPWPTRWNWSPQGAEILDIGGESTRPGAEPVVRGRGIAPRHCRSSNNWPGA